MIAMAYEKPLPEPNPDTRPFWEACQRHELRFQKCLSCGHVRWPASILCPVCYSRETEWIKSSGQGKVYTFVVHHQAFHPAFEPDLPYVTAVIDLEDGPHFLSNIVGCPPEDVACDMPVEVTWVDVHPDFSLPKFRPSR